MLLNLFRSFSCYILQGSVTLDSDRHCFVSVSISSPSKKELAAFLKKVSSREPNLYVVDVDVPLNILCKNDEKLEQVALGREFHISLGRTVPIRVHQIDSVVSMLRQKLQTQHQSVFFFFFFVQLWKMELLIFVLLFTWLLPLTSHLEADIASTLTNGRFLLMMITRAPFSLWKLFKEG